VPWLVLETNTQDRIYLKFVVDGDKVEIFAPNTSTGWAESGSRAALRRRTWGYWWMRDST